MMWKLLILIILTSCNPSSGDWVPCKGKSGIFLGTLQIVKNTCGEYLVDQDGTAGLEIPEESKLRKCEVHLIDTHEVSGPFTDHGWCEETLLTTIEPDGRKYIGRQYYELACIDPEFHCLAELEVELE